MEIRPYIILLATMMFGCTIAAGDITHLTKKSLQNAVRDNSETEVKRIIREQDTEVDKKLLLDSILAGDTLFSITIKSGAISMLKLLVQLGGDLHKKRTLIIVGQGKTETPLQYAVRCKEKQMCSVNIDAIISYLSEGYLTEGLPYGSPCTEDSQCRVGSLDKNLNTTVCKNGSCNCSSLQIRQFINGNYECNDDNFGDALHCLDDPNTCINGVCKHELQKQMCICNNGFVMLGKTCREILPVDYTEDCKSPASGPVPVCDYDSLMHCKSEGKCDCFSGYFYDKEDKVCISSNDYINKYPNETAANLNEPCGSSINVLPKVCKEEANMTCKHNKCRCTKEFYPVESNKTCQSKDSYVKAHNLTSYKVMPDQYCDDDADCITGLTCYKNKCACPHPCTFDKNKSLCDCGEVSAVEGASSAILVGVIGGLIIIVFWGHMIKKTMCKGNYKSMNERKNNDKPAAASFIPAVPLTDATTDPDAPSAPVGFSAPTTSAPPHQQPAPTYLGADATAPAPYTANTQTEATAPPPYTANTQTDPTAPPAVDIYKPIIY